MSMLQPLASSTPLVGQSEDGDSQVGQSSDSWAVLGFGLRCPLGQVLAHSPTGRTLSAPYTSVGYRLEPNPEPEPKPKRKFKPKDISSVFRLTCTYP